MDVQTNTILALIADDSKDEYVLFKSLLRPLNSIRLVGFVRDGNEAINYLQGVEQYKRRDAFPYPALLFLDLNMPKCDGMGVLEFLEHQVDRPLVILWSNTLHNVDVPRAHRLGADLVCAKPKNKSEMSNIIHHIEAKMRTIPPIVPVNVPARQIPTLGAT